MLKKQPDDSDGPNDKASAAAISRANWITLAFAVPILLISGIAFVMKFIELIRTFQDDAAGAFAITPMVNYSLASLGFLCLLLWAAINGTFRDMEEPKRIMLQREMMLDQQTKETKGASHVS